MRLETIRCASVAPFGLGMLILLGADSSNAQAPGAAPAPKQHEQLQQRGGWAKQVEELRQAGKFDDAVPVAERALVLERKSEPTNRDRVADALSSLAELHELRAD